MRHERNEAVDPIDAPAELVSSRYRYTALFGERVRWLPPHRLVPSFATADGQPVVYRRRSQVQVTDSAADAAPAQSTSYALGPSGYKVRVDDYGFARLVRPPRSQQTADPLTQLADDTEGMEREAALFVCRRLNQHVEAIGTPQRWTPPPTVQLVPTTSRAFPEPPPQEPRPRPASGGKDEAVLRTNVVNEYLDARAAWLKRRFAWENVQRAAKERSERAAAGDPRGMQEHLLACLHDVLWPASVFANYGFTGSEEAAFDIRIPGLDMLPEREARIAHGSRVAVRPMSDVTRTILHNRHAFGLVLRFLGESFAALPTLKRATVTGFQVPVGQRPRYIISATVERKVWKLLYAEKWITADNAERAMRALGARYDATGLGVFLPIEPFA